MFNIRNSKLIKNKLLGGVDSEIELNKRDKISSEFDPKSGYMQITFEYPSENIHHIKNYTVNAWDDIDKIKYYDCEDDYYNNTPIELTCENKTFTMDDEDQKELLTYYFLRDDSIPCILKADSKVHIPSIQKIINKAIQSFKDSL